MASNASGDCAAVDPSLSFVGPRMSVRVPVREVADGWRGGRVSAPASSEAELKRRGSISGDHTWVSNGWWGSCDREEAVGYFEHGDQHKASLDRFGGGVRGDLGIGA